MPAVEPLDILLKALKVTWDANAATLSGLNGPYRGEKPPDLTVGFPYVVVEAACKLRAWTCLKEYYDADVHFWVYHTTPELTATHLTTIKAVFDPENASIVLSTGDLVQKRPQETKYKREDKDVWRGSAPYSFIVSRPRVFS